MNKHHTPTFLWPLMAGLVLAAGCQKPQAPVAEKNDPLVRVSVITAQLSSFSETGLYYGKLAGTANATLVAALGGRVDAVLASEGSQVTAGQSLGRINADKAQATRDMVALAEKIAKENLDRQRQFFKDGNASQISVDQAELAWLTARNTTIDAQKALEGALAITPIGGTVTHRYVELYQELPPGSPTFAVASIDTMKVTIGIPEPEMAGVAEGNAAEVTVDSVPDRVWKGRVSRLGREVSSDTLTFAAEVTFDNADHRLLPGTSATVNLHRRDLANRILVPTEAVLTQGQQSFVMVEAAGVAHRVSVTLGPTSKTQTVIAQGLKAGDRVIVAGNNLTSDGARVVTGENQ